MSGLLFRYSRQNKKAIEEYIKKQLQEDIATDQISIKEYVDSFEKIKKVLGPLKR